MGIVEVNTGDNRQLQNIANVIVSAKRVIVVTGAGISTNCGIPDFRSEEGLYALIQSSYDQAASPQPSSSSSPGLSVRSSPLSAPSIPSNVKGKDLFDSILWKDPTSTSVFYTFIASLRKKIREEVRQTTPTHRFIRTLRDSKRLIRCYTQNIDGLEARDGLLADLSRGKGVRSRFVKKSPTVAKQPRHSNQDGGCEVVQLHGDLETLRCTYCQKTCGWEEDGREAMLLSGKAPECFSCALQDQSRRYRGKRGTKIGLLRPNIVLYGEEHPSADTIGTLTTYDLGFTPDVLLVLGTSLHVHGLKILVKEFAKSVHASGKGKVIFVNLSKPSESVWKDVVDYWVSMDCDDWVGSLKRHRPDLWHIQSELAPKITKTGVHPGKASSKKVAAKDDDEGKENAGWAAMTPSKSPMKVGLSASPRKRPLCDSTSTGSKQHKSQSPTKSAEKTLERKRSVTAPQLLTPPLTDRRARFWKESHEVPDSEEDAPSPPSKRSNPEVVIFQDPSPKRRRLEDFGQSWKVERTPLVSAQAKGIQSSMAVRNM